MGKESVVHFPDRKAWEAFGAEAYPTLAAGRPFVTERLDEAQGRLAVLVPGHGQLPWIPKDLVEGLDLDQRRHHRAQARRGGDPARAGEGEGAERAQVALRRR